MIHSFEVFVFFIFVVEKIWSYLKTLSINFLICSLNSFCVWFCLVLTENTRLSSVRNHDRKRSRVNPRNFLRLHTMPLSELVCCNYQSIQWWMSVKLYRTFHACSVLDTVTCYRDETFLYVSVRIRKGLSHQEWFKISNISVEHISERFLTTQQQLQLLELTKSRRKGVIPTHLPHSLTPAAYLITRASVVSSSFFLSLCFLCLSSLRTLSRSLWPPREHMKWWE